MVRKLLLALMTLLAALISAGCWDAIDINNKNITTLVAVDKQEDEYVFYVEIPGIANGSGNDENGGTRYSIETGRCATFAQAREDLNSKMDKPIFLGTVRTLVLSESLAQDDISKYLYRLQSIPDYRKTVGVVTTRSPVETLLAVQPENNVSVGYAIEDTAETLFAEGEAVLTTTSEILEWLYSDNVSFIIPNVDETDGNISLNGYTVIQDGHSAGYIPAQRAKGLVCFLNPAAKWRYVVPYGGRNEATVEATLKSKRIQPRKTEKGWMLDTSFVFDAIVMYKDTETPLNDNALFEINDELQKLLAADIETAVMQTREFGCEYLGFDDAFRISFPNEYEKMDWRAAYMRMAVRLSVKSTLDPGGMMDFEQKK